MAKVIVADENEGRRTLLANTLEREGFDITRAGTLRQAEGTALAIMPEIVLMDGDWKSGDAIDASQRLMSDPEFAFKCRIVILSRNSSQEYLTSAAQAGVSEVIAKPIDMSLLIEQLNKHARKQFVPPPADVAGPNSGGGSFDVSMLMGDSTWALPMLKGLVSPEKINPGFIDEILVQMNEEGLEVDDTFDPSMMANLLRIALNHLVKDVSPEDLPSEEKESAQQNQDAPSFENMSRGKTLGSGAGPSKPRKPRMTSMEEILEKQAESLGDEVVAKMDEILDEMPDLVALKRDEELFGIDLEVLKLTKLTTEVVHDLMWSLGRPGAVSDVTLITQIEDATQMLSDVLESLPEITEESIDEEVNSEEE
ncbi:MAG: response regulator [Candidatus Poseidoniales archaeon]|nr:MAG: response regulator [Candidatus Poseidoniales archaeon]